MMLTKLYLCLGHWLNNSLPRHDDHNIKCATCGNEEEHLSNLKYIYVGDNKMEGLCPRCYHGIVYYKRDYVNLKANPIPVDFKVYFKGE